MTMAQRSARLVSRQLGRGLKLLPTKPARYCIPSDTLCRNVPEAFARARWIHRRHLSSPVIEQCQSDILAHALRRVNEEGWTDEAVALGTLDAGLPPSYFGRASSAASPFGNADLVAFFMDRCNSDLRKQLAKEGGGERRGDDGGENANDDKRSPSRRIYEALRLRLSMVLPFATTNRWHEGMAIGALPQNARRTARQLDDMAGIVLEHALGGERRREAGPAQRAAVVAAYAAAELHLLAELKGGSDVAGGGSLSLGGERHRATWDFLRARSDDAARFIATGAGMPSLGGLPLPSPHHVVAASAVASSLAGAALSMAAPSAAAWAGYYVPQAAAAALAPLQSVAGNQDGARERDWTDPRDYADDVGSLPPFDAAEEIFPDGSNRDRGGDAADRRAK